MSVVFEAVIRELKTQRDMALDRAAKLAGELAAANAKVADLQQRIGAQAQKDADARAE